MQLIRVGGAALNQTPLDWNGNRDRIVAACGRHGERRVAVLCLPELASVATAAKTPFIPPGVHRTGGRVLLELVPETRGMRWPPWAAGPLGKQHL